MTQNRFKLTLYVMSITMLSFVACEQDKTLEPDNSEQATLSTIQASIFSQSCGVSGCHVPGGAGLMPLRTAQESFQNLVGVASIQKPDLDRVTPNDPDNSYLIQKLEGAPGIVGERMPFGRSPLAQEQIDLIREWIADGAQNN